MKTLPNYLSVYINSTLNSNLIVDRTMEIEALIRCVEAHNKGMPSEEVYKKYIGIEESEDSIDNLYFNKRLDTAQKQRIAVNCDAMFSEVIFFAYGRGGFFKKYSSRCKKEC